MRARGSSTGTGGGAWRSVRCMAFNTDYFGGVCGCVQTPLATGLPRMSRSAEDDLCGGDEKSSGLYGVGLLNRDGCRSGTQGRRLGDVGGSMARNCSCYYDGGRNIENGVTPIKTRLLRKC